MNRVWMLFLILTIGSAATAAADSGMRAMPLPDPVHIPFAPGERLEFGVRYGMVRAGDATLSVEGVPENTDGDVYRLVSTAESSRFFSTFFRVEDRVESLWSTRDRVPLRFRKQIREGNYEKDVLVHFDHVANLARYQGGESESILPGTQDVLSAFYYVRLHDLEPGTVIEVPNHSNHKNYPLEVRILRRERIEVPAGTFNCIVVEPMLKTAGLFKQEGRLSIWLTDDSRRMPVLMKSKVPVGSIVAELESFRMGRPPRARGSSSVASTADRGDR